MTKVYISHPLVPTTPLPSENHFSQWNFRIKIAPLIEYVKLWISAKKWKKKVYRFKMAAILLILLPCDCAILRKLKKHLRWHCCLSTSIRFNNKDVVILDRDYRWYERGVKEAMEQPSSLNLVSLTVLWSPRFLLRFWLRTFSTSACDLNIRSQVN